MGSVHFGVLRDGSEPKSVAVKQLHAEHARDPASVAMLLDEVRLTRLAHHPNVIPVVDFAYDGEHMILVMEYVHGESLRHLLTAAKKQQRPVPARVAAAVLLDVLRALHAAHNARDEAGNALCLVHRDVTPENILVGSNGVTRLVDFGVAKANGRLHATRAGGVKGKFAYLAPEQIGGDVTLRADLFAAGLVFWEALVGERAFKGKDEAELIGQALNPKIPPASSLVGGITPELDDVIARALAAVPEQRYESAEQFAAAIERVLGPANIAGADEVGAWTLELLGDKLRERADRMAEIIRDERRRTAKRSLPFVAAGGAMLFAGALVFLGRSLVASSAPISTDVQHASPPPSATPTAPPVAHAGPAPQAAVGSAAAAADRAPPMPPTVSSARPPKKRAAVPTAVSPSSAGARRDDACDPPFVIDSKGIRTYKQECFQ
ncbi:serine/threonine protein kinase [Pendulispora rubella]|uniref:Serine/threonine protein kinase n=2 Tax=Pendulispora rubella TaxID=2741070 RepID=A0ABZ2KY64_9BACT